MMYATLSVLFVLFLGFIGYRANQRARILKSREPVKFHPAYYNPLRNKGGATKTTTKAEAAVIARTEEIRIESRNRAQQSLEIQLPLLKKETLLTYSKQLSARVERQKARIENKNLPLPC